MELQERQIRKRLAEDFEPYIDMSDSAHHNAEEQAKIRTSRALAAMSIAANAKIPVDEACASVVDESGDAGIDAIGLALAKGEVYVVQAKTSPGAPSPTEVMKFTRGIRLFLDWDWEHLGLKARRRRSEFEDALEGDVRIIAVFSYLGSQEANEDARWDSGKLTEEVNSSGDILDFRYEGLRENYEHRNIANGLASPNYELAFDRWVTMSDYRSEIMGIVTGDQLASMVEMFNERLFDKNIRAILKSTETNENLDSTLRDAPQDFWYYNNGITVVANAVSCRRSNPRSVDEAFFLKGLSVVNGAQTCGALARAFRDGVSLEDVRVTVRVISTEGHSGDFEKQVTRYTNTQNQVTNREFVSLDSFQQEICDSLLSENIQYCFRTGQELDVEEYSFAFDLEEATRALACLAGVNIATRAKREIGKMWADLNSTPYLDIFPRTLDAATIYNAVRFWRSFTVALNEAGRRMEQRPRNIVRNAEYMACALFMQWARKDGVQFSNIEWDVNAWMSEQVEMVGKIAEKVVEFHEEVNPGGFAMSFFKNVTKVDDFARKFRASVLADIDSAHKEA